MKNSSESFIASLLKIATMSKKIFSVQCLNQTSISKGVTLFNIFKSSGALKQARYFRTSRV